MLFCVSNFVKQEKTTKHLLCVFTVVSNVLEKRKNFLLLRYMSTKTICPGILFLYLFTWWKCHKTTNILQSWRIFLFRGIWCFTWPTYTGLLCYKVWQCGLPLSTNEEKHLFVLFWEEEAGIWRNFTRFKLNLIFYLRYFGFLTSAEELLW